MVLLTEAVIKGKTKSDKLEEVKNLNLWGQELEDVSVLSKLTSVEVLSLSVNRISSLRHFKHCSRLQELYLRKNEVADLSDLQHLKPLKDLRVLWLVENPCADHPQYRQLVLQALPELQKLDNEDVSAEERAAAVAAAASAAASNSSSAGNGNGVGAGGAGGALSRQASGNAPPAVASSSSNGAGSGATAAAAAAAVAAAAAAQQQRQAAFANRAGGGGSSSSSNTEGDRNGHVNGNGVAGKGEANGFNKAVNGSGRKAGGSKNVLYAVLALLAELEENDLMFVAKDIEQRLKGCA